MNFLFQSTLPVGERHLLCHFLNVIFDFNPRSPWGSDFALPMQGTQWNYFNPRSPWGSDSIRQLFHLPLLRFQSTLPVGERRVILNQVCGIPGFQSTLPVGERLSRVCHISQNANISIHAPRGGATYDIRESNIAKRFQSTLPVGERQQRCTNLSVHLWREQTKSTKNHSQKNRSHS